MVSFRFHLTSLVAVFLSLGLGLLMGASLSEHGGVREEQQMLIASIERSLEQLRAEKASLQNSLTQMQAQMHLYDELVLSAGQALVGDQLSGKGITLVASATDARAESLATLLESLKMHVSRIAWELGSENMPETETAALVDGLTAYLINRQLSAHLEPLVAAGSVHLDDFTGETDYIVVLMDEADNVMARLAEKMAGHGHNGLLAVTGSPAADFVEFLAGTGWDIVPYSESLPGMLGIVAHLAGSQRPKAGQGVETSHSHRSGV